MPEPAVEEQTEGLEAFKANIRRLPRSIKEATVRHGPRTSARAASQSVFGNLFLHIHSVRTHRYNFKRSFTMEKNPAGCILYKE